MSVAVIKTPNTDVNGHVSKWQAVHEPIEYTIERQDQQVQVKYKPTLLTVWIQVIGAIPIEVQVGQRILWKSGTNSEVFTILGINGTTIVTDGTISGTVIGGHVVYLDAYLNWFLETEILVVGVNNYQSIGTLKNKSDDEGLVDINVANYLKTVCVYQNDFEYNQLNYAVKGESGQYNIRFREIYNGIEQPLSNPFGAVQYFSNSSKQILEEYGANMGEYVPTLDNTRPNKAKFMTVFDKPTVFKDMPFSTSFIYSDNLANNEIEMIQTGFNINGMDFWDGDAILNHLHRQEVNRLMIIDGMPDNIAGFTIFLQITGSLITTPPLDNGKVFEPGFAEPEQPLNPTPPNPTS